LQKVNIFLCLARFTDLIRVSTGRYIHEKLSLIRIKLTEVFVEYNVAMAAISLRSLQQLRK